MAGHVANEKVLYLENGAWQGGSIIYWSKLLKHPETLVLTYTLLLIPWYLYLDEFDYVEHETAHSVRSECASTCGATPRRRHANVTYRVENDGRSGLGW